jgi:hypothetical protein
MKVGRCRSHDISLHLAPSIYIVMKSVTAETFANHGFYTLDTHMNFFCTGLRDYLQRLSSFRHCFFKFSGAEESVYIFKTVGMELGADLE